MRNRPPVEKAVSNKLAMGSVERHWSRSTHRIFVGRSQGSHPRIYAKCNWRKKLATGKPVTSGPLRLEAQLLYRRARPETMHAYSLPEDTYGTERRVAQATLQVQIP